jgi:N-acetylglucosamine-6-phosphate deacetylase
MIETLNLINARIPGYEGLQEVVIRQGVIEQILPWKNSTASSSENVASVDLLGDWLSFGGVDLQINGALGLAFPDLNQENVDKLDKICEFLWNQGVDGFLPTIVTTSVENIQRSLSTLTSHPTPHTPHFTSQILGVHLEGPFLNLQKRGAHPEEYLLPLTIENVKRVLGDYASIVKTITLAPELDCIGEVIPYLKSLGITVSLGHSLATAEQAQRAFEQGATMVTHAFNAMPPLHHREPGLLGAAIVNPNVHCGLIADGQHVSPIMMDILLRASHYDQGIFLVSDALSPLGLPDGIYPWDTRQIEVSHGTARLLDGTLSGTTLPLLVGAQNLVKWSLCDAERAIALATTAPRRAIGLPSNLIGSPMTQLLCWQQTASGDLIWRRLAKDFPL